MEMQRQQLASLNITDITMMAVNANISSDYLKNLTDIVNFPVYQESESENQDIWDTLGGGLDDFFIYDRCGDLVDYIPVRKLRAENRNFTASIINATRITYASVECVCKKEQGESEIEETNGEDEDEEETAEENEGDEENSEENEGEEEADEENSEENEGEEEGDEENNEENEVEEEGDEENSEENEDEGEETNEDNEDEDGDEETNEEDGVEEENEED